MLRAASGRRWPRRLSCARARLVHRGDKMKRILAAALAVLLGSLAVGALAENISIATGGTGGVYYPLGGGLAEVLSKHVPGMQATAEVTGGSVDNLRLIGSGKPYIAFVMTDAAQD